MNEYSNNLTDRKKKNEKMKKKKMKNYFADVFAHRFTTNTSVNLRIHTKHCQYTIHTQRCRVLVKRRSHLNVHKIAQCQQHFLTLLRQLARRREYQRLHTPPHSNR